MNLTWADRVAKMDSPAVKAILKITQRNDIISFAGGLPSAQSFPVAELASSFQAVLQDQGAAALQYGPTEGYEPLRHWVSERLGKQGIVCSAANVIITNGSQQGLDLVARVFLNPGDYVAVENPTYLAAVQCFRGAEANLIPIPLENDGINVEVLAQAIRANRPKFIYVNPNFQNPTGVTMSMEKRRKLVQLAADEQIPLVEDNPYGELRYNGDEVAALKSLPGGEWVIYAGTISKIIAPGLRVGWLVGDKQIIDKMADVKQTSDVLTNSLTQRAIYHYVTNNNVDSHINTIVCQYREKRDVMLTAMKEHFPSEVKWTSPDGGMFIWVTLPESMDANKLLSEAIEAKVAFVPGTPFYANNDSTNAMRINFSNSTPELIREGISNLGKLLKRHIL